MAYGLKASSCHPLNMVSADHVILDPHASVKCADGIAACSIAGTIESYPFKTFLFDDVTIPNFVCVMMSLFQD